MKNFTGIMLIFTIGVALLLSDSLVTSQPIAAQGLEQKLIEEILDNPIDRLRLIQTVSTLPEATRLQLQRTFPILSALLVSG